MCLHTRGCSELEGNSQHKSLVLIEPKTVGYEENYCKVENRNWILPVLSPVPAPSTQLLWPSLSHLASVTRSTLAALPAKSQMAGLLPVKLDN